MFIRSSADLSLGKELAALMGRARASPCGLPRRRTFSFVDNKALGDDCGWGKTFQACEPFLPTERHAAKYGHKNVRSSQIGVRLGLSAIL